MKQRLIELWKFFEKRRQIVKNEFEQHKEKRIETEQSLYDPIYKQVVQILNNEYCDILDEIKILIDSISVEENKSLIASYNSVLLKKRF